MYNEAQELRFHNLLPEEDCRGFEHNDSFSAGSSGTYRYHVPGADLASPGHTHIWDGECFACWSYIPPTFMLNRISYDNPLPGMDIPTGLGAYLATGWDVIRGPFGGRNLPAYAQLRGEDVRHFDCTTRSMMEASLYFRLIRAFKEQISLVQTAAILRNRFPDTSNEVLLALAAFSPCYPAGATHHNVSFRNGGNLSTHMVEPNSTLGPGLDIRWCIGELRNWLWASENSGWQIHKLRTATDTTGPFSRRYYGQNYFWSGKGRYFHVNLKVPGFTEEQFTDRRLWSYHQFASDNAMRFGELRSFGVIDALHGVLVEIEPELKGLAPECPAVVNIDPDQFPGLRERVAAIADRRERRSY